MYLLPPPAPNYPARRQEPHVFSAAQHFPAQPSLSTRQPPHSRIAVSLIPSYLIPSNSFVFICFKLFYSNPPPAGLESCPTSFTNFGQSVRLSYMNPRQRSPGAIISRALRHVFRGRRACPRGNPWMFFSRAQRRGIGCRRSSVIRLPSFSPLTFPPNLRIIISIYIELIR